VRISSMAWLFPEQFELVVAAVAVTRTVLVPGTQLFETQLTGASVIGVGADGQTGFAMYPSALGTSSVVPSTYAVFIYKDARRTIIFAIRLRFS
jgi:hypothetical protein